MPELPEVETVRRGLEPVLDGHVLADVVQRRPDLRWPLPERFAERLTGRRVMRLRRRSKWILIDLEAGAEVPETWMVHLGMSGKMLIDGAETADLHHDRATPQKHDHVVVTTDAGARITYNDARRFGAMDLWPTATLSEHPQLATLGPEPLGNDFNAAVLEVAFAGRMTPVKAALLDQKTVAGLGNIYVCEALFRSGIHPTRMAGSISAKRVAVLAREIVATLGEAIEAGGSSLRDYRKADGELGYFQHAFKVYDREEKPCVTVDCVGEIRRIVQSGRSTFYCPKCQR
ncbi:MAG: bifunctional DNA-formamidopyrimidine glycosylase/DNA-(apurinic or apyrimidinic site) lyase [Pseudomonadota bacterium]